MENYKLRGAVVVLDKMLGDLHVMCGILDKEGSGADPPPRLWISIHLTKPIGFWWRDSSTRITTSSTHLMDLLYQAYVFSYGDKAHYKL